MAYYPKKEGLEAFEERKTLKDKVCFVCNDKIKAGEKRFVTGKSLISLCKPCLLCWKKEGGRLGEISRSQRYKKTVPGGFPEKK